MIVDDVSDEERKGFFKIIQQSSDQLLSRINDILEISELNTNQAKLFKRSVNLDQLRFLLKEQIVIMSFMLVIQELVSTVA